jgi:hypothetical protein
MPPGRSVEHSIQKSFQLERKVERDGGVKTICAERDVFTGKDMKFLLIIFQRAVRMLGTGFDTEPTGPPARHFRRVRRIFRGLTLPKKYHPQKGFTMPELLTAATYLIVWLICVRVIGIESGLTKLILSLGAAVFVFVLLTLKDRQRKKKRDDR